MSNYVSSEQEQRWERHPPPPKKKIKNPKRQINYTSCRGEGGGCNEDRDIKEQSCLQCNFSSIKQRKELRKEESKKRIISVTTSVQKEFYFKTQLKCSFLYNLQISMYLNWKLYGSKERVQCTCRGRKHGFFSI